MKKALLTLLALTGGLASLSAQLAPPSATNAPEHAPNSEEAAAARRAARELMNRMYVQLDKTNPSSPSTLTNQALNQMPAQPATAAPTLSPLNTVQKAATPANDKISPVENAAATNIQPTSPTPAPLPAGSPAQLHNLPLGATNAPPARPQPGATTFQAAPGQPPGPGTQPGNLPAEPPSSTLGTAVPPAGLTPPPNTNALATATSPAPLKEDEILPPGLIKLQEADVVQVLEGMYQELTGRTVLRPANLPQVKITMYTQTELTRKEAVQALDSILALNGITMVPQGEKFVKAVATQQASQEARQFNTEPYETLPESGSFVVQIVKLKHTVPRDVAQALQPFAKNPQAILGIDASGIVILRDNAENVKRMMEVLEQVDVIPVQEFESIVIPIKYALASDIAQVLSTLTEGGSATTVGASTAQTGLTTGGGLGARGTGTLGGSNPYNPQSRTTTTPQVGQQSSFQERLRGIVNRAIQAGGGDITVLGQTKIIADERTNSLLIFASKNDIPTIKDIVDKLDVVLPQVLIEAIIMEVDLNENWDYGVSWIQRPQQLGNFTGNGMNITTINPQENPLSLTNILDAAAGFRYFGKFNNDFDVALKASAGDSRANVLSRPRIQTSHAVEANLFVGETRPYITGTYFGGSGFGSTSQYQQLQIGITLSVLPLINADGLVVMDIRQRIQSVGGKVVIDGNEVPITKDREANAKVAVQDRETIFLGGFISSDQQKDKQGIPILKDIPLLGFLFRSQSKQDLRRELVVLIRPTVLPTPIEAAQIAKELRHDLPGIVAAERAFNQSEKQRSEQLNRDLLKREGFKY